jgi:hypothetical protein
VLDEKLLTADLEKSRPSRVQQQPHVSTTRQSIMSDEVEKMPYGDASSQEAPDREVGEIMNADEAHLASLGYKQEFIRTLGIFENWAATFTVCLLDHHFRMTRLISSSL